MAAMTMSFDKDACRYAAAVQTNGYRVEMISPANMRNMFLPLFQKWISKVGGGKVMYLISSSKRHWLIFQGPAHIYYFRDGVSEGQYSMVINEEIKHMKDTIDEHYGLGMAAQVSTLLSLFLLARN